MHGFCEDYMGVIGVEGFGLKDVEAFGVRVSFEG